VAQRRAGKREASVETLSTKNLVLRPFGLADAEQFVEAVRESEETVGKWLPWWKADFSNNDALAWFQACEAAIAAKTAFDIGVFRDDSGLLIGSVAINRIDAAHRIASIGYWVRESQQSNGYCSEAVNRIAKFGFDDLALIRLEIVALVENTASRKVAEKCGARLECIAENRLMYNDRPSAAAIYSLIPSMTFQ
jgi:RimJ/RimL family protein N-acetyltransferase